MARQASWDQLEQDAAGYGPQVAEAIALFRSTYLALPRLLSLGKVTWPDEDRQLLRYATVRVRSQLEALDRLLAQRLDAGAAADRLTER